MCGTAAGGREAGVGASTTPPLHVVGVPTVHAPGFGVCGVNGTAELLLHIRQVINAPVPELLGFDRCYVALAGDAVVHDRDSGVMVGRVVESGGCNFHQRILLVDEGLPEVGAPLGGRGVGDVVRVDRAPDGVADDCTSAAIAGGLAASFRSVDVQIAAGAFGNELVLAGTNQG